MMTNSRQNNTEPGQRRERLAFWGFLAVVVLFSLGVWVAEAGAQGTFIDPTAYGSPLWQGAVADEGALDACDGDTADTIHWLVDEAAVAYCPADGSDWEINEFSGGGGGSGTVESVAMTVPTGFTLSGSPITTSGTFTLGLSTQAAGRVWAGPASGAAAAPTFRALVATDIPTPLTSSTSGNAGTATALSSNPANCSAGSGAGGIAANGAAEDCTAYLTGIGAEDLGDLANVSETGAATGEALVSDGAGAWSPSAAAVCLSNGTNCPASGATPGGSDNQVQVNESGAFAGDSDFTYDASAATTATKFAVIGSLATTKVDGYGRLLVDQAATCPSTFGGLCVSWSGTVLARFGANLGISTDKADSSGTGKFIFATTTEVGLSNYNGPVILNPATTGTHQETSFLANGAMRLPAIATAPATCTAYRDFYVDTSGAFCWCSATNTWTVFTGGGTCV